MKQANIETLIQHNNELLDWKYSASKILNNIDLQKVGKLINVPLGSDVSTEILPFIEKSIEMKKLLVEEIYPVLVEMDKYETLQKIQKLLNAI